MSTPALPSPALPSGEPPAIPARLRGPDVATIGLTLGFAALLLLLHVPVEVAVITAVSTVGTMVIVVLVPKAIIQVLGTLREINKRLGGGE